MNALVDIGVRLRTERERIRKTQADLGTVAGVTRQTQANYESGDRAPDAAYLAAISQVGVDVQYVVTGTRQVPTSTPPVYEAREPQASSGAQPQVQTQGQTQGAADDWPETPTGPAISLEMMRRVVGLVDAIIKQRGQSPGRDKEIEMIVMAYNYVVVGDDDETKDTVRDREVKRLVRLVANG